MSAWRQTMATWCAMLAATFLTVGGGRLLAQPAGSQPATTDLPSNKWVKLPAKAKPGPVLCAPIYVPTRGQLLHWGQADQWDKTCSNDVRAFDAKAGDWVCDYPSDPGSWPAANGLAGQGSMLPSGRPRPSMVLHGVCWDSTRERVIYTMSGLMAAYDPKTRTWTDLKARTVMPTSMAEFTVAEGSPKPTGKMKTEFPGGPPVYGMGTGYDPVNDEVILFPHFDTKNVSMRAATGQVSGHQGTFRYSFKDNTWRVVSDTFGSDEMKTARKALLAAMATASSAMDAAWVLNRRPDAGKTAEVAKTFESAAGDMGKLALPADAKAGLEPVAGLLKSAGEAVSGGKPGDALKPARDALWAMNDAIEGALRVEPPPRCAAPIVYDPKNKCLVMFGGHTNLWRSDGGNGPNVMVGQNDTWLYDVTTRQWRETAVTNRPPLGQFVGRVPMLTYDDVSGLVLLFTRTGDIWNAKIPKKAQVWALDVAKGEWSKRLETDWPGPMTMLSGHGSESPHSQAPTAMFAFNVRDRLALIVQPEGTAMATYALKLDLTGLPSEPAPAYKPATPIRPQEVPADDPAWVEKLKNLPVNVWTDTKARTTARGWGMLALDPVRGWAVYQGGGHSSWQVNNVDIYTVGANKWSRQVGDHNGYVPPNEWEGNALGYRGGPRGRHERNTYQALDGRVYNYIGCADAYQDGTMYLDPGYVRFYDIDRGGIHRELPLAGAGSVAAGLRSNLVVDPQGRVLALGSASYDIYANAVTAWKSANSAGLEWLGESRPFCYLPDRDQIAVLGGRSETGADGKKSPRTLTGRLFNVKDRAWVDLPAKCTPPCKPVWMLEYAQNHKCLMASIDNQVWIYSLEKGDWTQMPVKTAGGTMKFQGPYGQLVWVEKYGVFVNLYGNDGVTAWVMRPDFSQLKWE